MPKELLKKSLISRMEASACYLVDRKIHHKPKEGTGIHKPEQNGLAYSLGSKQFINRRIPPGDKCVCKADSLYGLDCSGMIYQMAHYAGLPLYQDSCNALFLGQPVNWNNAFKKSIVYKDLVMEDLGQVPIDSIIFGDIVVWEHHIGMVLKSGNTLKVFQSNGHNTPHECILNTDIDHGPTIKNCTKGFLLDKSFGGKFKILRINRYFFDVTIDGIDFEMKYPYYDRSYSDPNYPAIEFSMFGSIATPAYPTIQISVANLNHVGSYSLNIVATPYGDCLNHLTYFVSSTEAYFITCDNNTPTHGSVTVTSLTSYSMDGTFNCVVGTMDNNAQWILHNLTNGVFSLKRHIRAKE